jgi:hypothetical protein
MINFVRAYIAFATGFLIYNLPAAFKGTLTVSDQQLVVITGLFLAAHAAIPAILYKRRN